MTTSRSECVFPLLSLRRLLIPIESLASALVPSPSGYVSSQTRVAGTRRVALRIFSNAIAKFYISSSPKKRPVSQGKITIC